MLKNKPIPKMSMIDELWLTQQLRTAGFENTTVKSFTAEPIGTGQMARCFRLNLDLDSRDSQVPKSFIAKVKSESQASQEMAKQALVYRREVDFYKLIKQHLSITTPKCYFADIADDDLNFIILLEDLQSAEPGNQLAGCGPDVARNAVLELVGLHGPSLNNPALSEAGHPMYVEALSIEQIRQTYINSVPGFIERHGEAFDTEQIAILEKLAMFEEPAFSKTNIPFSLIHQDFRLDNLLITATESGPQPTVVDWQTYSIGNPLSDVAYFLSSSMAPDIRRDVEQEIVREYHDNLLKTGDHSFTWDDCWLAYRKASLYGFSVAVGSAMMVQRTERGDHMFRLMVDRHTRQALDLNAEELFA